MSVEMLTYAALGARLKISPKAARSLSRRLMLPRSLSDDGKALVSVDPAEIRHKPRPQRARADSTVLAAKIEALKAEIARLETTAADHRADFEREWSAPIAWRLSCFRRLPSYGNQGDDGTA